MSVPGKVSLCCLCAVAMLSSPQSASAQSDDSPVAYITATGGFRMNVGTLGDAYGWGVQWGGRAGYEPLRFSDRLALGLVASVSWGYYFAAEQSLVDREPSFLDMRLGFKLRRLIGITSPRYLSVSVGGSALRLGTPVPPDDERSYVGPYIGAGLDQYVRFGGRRWIMSFETSYGMLGVGPATTTFILSFGTAG